MVNDDVNVMFSKRILWISFPQHTESQNSVDESHGDRKFSTSHTMSVDESHNVKWWYTRWPQVFHITQNVCWRITRWLEVFKITHNVKCLLTNHTMTRSFYTTLKTTMSNVCRRITQWPQVFHSALITTMSASCRHHTIFATSIIVITKFSSQDHWCKFLKTVNVRTDKYLAKKCI